MDIISEIRFHAQVHEDAKRTLCCAPERVEALEAAIARRGLSDLWTVVGSPAVPSGQVIVLDEQALQASMNQTSQRAAKDIRIH